jgi:hypothetical protein
MKAEHYLRHPEARDESIGPNASHQVVLADQLFVAFKQSNQDFRSATSERHGLVAFQQKELRSKQAKRSDRNFCRRCAGWFGSLLEEWPGRIRTLNGASDVKLRFEMKLLQASESPRDQRAWRLLTRVCPRSE